VAYRSFDFEARLARFKVVEKYSRAVCALQPRSYPSQSLLSLIVASVCLEQNATLCAPLPIRHDASLMHLVISQNETDDTHSSVPKLFLSEEEDQLFPRLRWFAMTYQP